MSPWFVVLQPLIFDESIDKLDIVGLLLISSGFWLSQPLCATDTMQGVVQLMCSSFYHATSNKRYRFLSAASTMKGGKGSLGVPPFWSSQCLRHCMPVKLVFIVDWPLRVQWSSFIVVESPFWWANLGGTAATSLPWLMALISNWNYL